LLYVDLNALLTQPVLRFSGDLKVSVVCDTIPAPLRNIRRELSATRVPYVTPVSEEPVKETLLVCAAVHILLRSLLHKRNVWGGLAWSQSVARRQAIATHSTVPAVLLVGPTLATAEVQIVPRGIAVSWQPLAKISRADLAWRSRVGFRLHAPLNVQSQSVARRWTDAKQRTAGPPTFCQTQLADFATALPVLLRNVALLADCRVAPLVDASLIPIPVCCFRAFRM